MGMVEDALEWLADTAEKLGLDDDEKDQFISAGMKRQGFKQSSIWTEPEPDNGSEDSGDFFSVRRKAAEGEREQRQVSTQRRDRRASGDSGGAGWQYGGK